MTIKLEVMNSETTSAGDPNRSGQTSCRPEAHFFIYQNLAYVSDQRFAKAHISIGRSPQADVVLDHNSVADIHALVHFEGEQAFLTNKYPSNGLRLNGRSVNIESLQHEDVIDIGPFSLKIKIDASPLTQSVVPDVRYAVRLVNRYQSAEQRQAALGVWMTRSTDGGLRWEFVHQIENADCFCLKSVSAAGRTVVVVGCDSRILRSDDGGATWQDVSL